MKPVYAKILEGSEIATFATREVNRPFFSTEFHFHSACQMTYIVKSEGKRIIGDNVDRFLKDELTFIGSDLPHVWHNDQINTPTHNEAKSLALYIEPALIVQAFAQFFNTSKLEAFFNLSKRGLIFYGKTKDELKKKLVKIVKLPYGPQKTILLIEIIEILLNCSEYESISSTGYTNNYNPIDNNKIERVFKYVFDNYPKEILLSDVSDMSSMSKHAFCRYFKSRTQKTFIQFVNEVRISEACKMIAENSIQITNIAYECGFNSLSNFNKIFKSVKGITPTEYKSQIFK
ncbi:MULTISPECIES: AraC family transcriptional regulator [Sphingobacterium]|uniref:AraC family transcriptional regulator n=1 Tax=Sphingobacterium cellulitidis TaxID=1768011 RepID=A0A8H9G032_9SPHI|nr:MULTISPECIES: AraC family transcriptional regulator [Sphingobacterium]MBA8987630.1 AraC-like DNA-binding protein [Sphingobacterium soli]WFB64303.1 AraC family transcriptional regulator [Sphingobacterium sp. WM]GGE21852.1 AraC family transcriptional regulator [Sphingobacterium soli]